MALLLVPVTQAEAKRFIARHHRHNNPSIGSIFNVGVRDEEGIVGVAMVGIPKARALMDGTTLEVTRVCTNGAWNANSMLYGACVRAAKALGWKRLVTYTLESESGASLRAAGWKCDEKPLTRSVAGWKTNGKWVYDLFGNERLPSGPKIRWWRHL